VVLPARDDDGRGQSARLVHVWGLGVKESKLGEHVQRWPPRRLVIFLDTAVGLTAMKGEAWSQ